MPRVVPRQSRWTAAAAPTHPGAASQIIAIELGNGRGETEIKTVGKAFVKRDSAR